MLLSQLDNKTNLTILTHPVWQEVFAWLQNMPSNLPEGEHLIKGRDIYASRQNVATQPRRLCAFESHKQYIDLHLCLGGGEIIEYAPASQLKPRGEYDEAKDFFFYHPIDQATTCLLQPGTFAIFWPQDAHMPKITDGQNKETEKVVVKIKASLIKP
ncbi:MAG: YhcH/YjgK/YiaL family protein [Candidatus Andersenbacteria bacterium]|nr:YhcH/YjgK/YiaL family protein [bacterium]MDZ4225397.1 YhcH/YjgK/YiaL family protein [Candidatus Andersenbacteria bacterium]